MPKLRFAHGRKGTSPRFNEKERPFGRSSLHPGNQDYLLIFRRSAITRAPRPIRPIVAGSGIEVIVPSIDSATCAVVEGRLSKRTQAELPELVPP